MSVVTDLVTATNQLLADSVRISMLTTPVVRTANCVAEVCQRIEADTTGGGFTVTMPPSPEAGDRVYLNDPALTWGDNNLTVNGNGHTIEGGDHLICDRPALVELCYSAVAGEWQVRVTPVVTP